MQTIGWMAASEDRRLTVALVMRRYFVSAPPETSRIDARQLMRLARLRHLVVSREERLIGLLSYRALLESLLAQPDAGDTIASAMVPCPVVVEPDTPLLEAAGRLCRYGIGCLPVIETDDEPRLVGLVTESDLLRVAFRG
jgi:CBS domain-containing protein